MTTLHPTTTSAGPAAGQAATVVARWLDDAQTIGVALSSDGRTLYKLARSGDQVSCECTGYGYRQYCRHTTALEALLPVKVFACGNCGEKLCAAPRTYCAGCLAQLKAECGRIAALRQVEPSTRAEIAATEQLMADTLSGLLGLCPHGIPTDAFCAPCHHKAVDAAIEVRRAQDKAERIAGYRAELASGTDIWA